jgi:type 1 fimbriae regulatory protein FimB
MRRPERTEKIKFLTPAETIRLFSVMESKRDRAIFLIAYQHGLRASEVGHLRSTDLDLVRMRIRIYRVKGSHGGDHPLQPDEVKAIKSYLRSRSDTSPILFPSNRREPISRKMLDVLMKRYGEQAKIPKDKRHFHVLKHSIATHLLDAGADLRFVQDWLGHAQISNTVIYTFISSASRDERARHLFPKLPRLR